MSTDCMEGTTVNTPILFLLYNRPGNTKRVFEVLREVKPNRLYIACDGPKSDRVGDYNRVADVREIVSCVDWNCEVKTLFRESNLGCKVAVEQAITWFFEYENYGIILEDDCLPNKSFFFFCEELLQKYQHDNRVFAITGDNFQKGRQFGNTSYYFSRYVHVWGWATWRRAWKHYDPDLSFWPTFKNSSQWETQFSEKIEKTYWEMIFNRVHANEINTWDYYWVGSVWKQGGLTATPNQNLVSNIGFGKDSTHTVYSNSPLANMPTYELGNVIHSAEVVRNMEADQNAFDFVFNGRSTRWPVVPLFLFFRLIRKFFRWLKRYLHFTKLRS